MWFLVFMIFLNYQMGGKIIATDTLEISKVQQIRLILGTKRKYRGTRRYNLSIEYLKCRAVRLETQVNQTLQEVMYHVLLDFDANKSIVKLGNGG
jgi:hypothetical protein